MGLVQYHPVPRTGRDCPRDGSIDELDAKLPRNPSGPGASAQHDMTGSPKPACQRRCPDQVPVPETGASRDAEEESHAGCMMSSSD